MKPADTRALVASVLEKTGVRLDADDPAFVLVELNRIMLENYASEVAGKIEEAAKKLNTIATAQADGFVAVANETLTKFTARSREIQAMLAELPEAREERGKCQNTRKQKNTDPRPASPESSQAQTSATSRWPLAAAFLGGIIVGLAVSIIA